MTPPRSPSSSPRIQDSSSNDKKSNCFQCCIPWTSFILVMGGVGVIIYNFIYTIIAIINFLSLYSKFLEQLLYSLKLCEKKQLVQNEYFHPFPSTFLEQLAAVLYHMKNLISI
mgnify:CR=1 FL=1